MEKSILKKTKDKAQKVFNEYIRLRDSLETTGCPFGAICCTCGNQISNSGDLQAGHYILDSKNGNSTSFDEHNVHGQCKSCNRYHHGMLAEYSLFIVEKYGQKELERLHRKKHDIKKWTIIELEEIITTYKKKIVNIYLDMPKKKL